MDIESLKIKIYNNILFPMKYNMNRLKILFSHRIMITPMYAIACASSHKIDTIYKAAWQGENLISKIKAIRLLWTYHPFETYANDSFILFDGIVLASCLSISIGDVEFYLYFNKKYKWNPAGEKYKIRFPRMLRQL